MKALFLILTLSLLSCGTSKNNETTLAGQTKGVVVVTDDCAIIEVTLDGEKITMYPINLDNTFKKTDLIILFDHSPSKAPQPTNCNVDRVVSVQNVRLFEK